MSLEVSVYARLLASKDNVAVDKNTGLGSGGAVSPLRFPWAASAPHHSADTQDIGSAVHEALQIGDDIPTPGFGFFRNLATDPTNIIHLGVLGLVLSTPGAPTVAPQGVTGAAHYGYKVTAADASGETLASTEGTTTTGNAVLSVSNFNRVSWSAVTGATSYKVYGRTSGGPWLFIATVAAPTVQYDDTGAVVTPAGAVPSQNTTGFIKLVKARAGGIALFELSTANVYAKAEAGTPRLDWEIIDP